MNKGPKDCDDILENDDNHCTFIHVGEFCFTPDFRSVAYRGKLLFKFSVKQAYICQVLYDHYKEGHPEVSQQWLLGLLGREDYESKRLRDSYFKQSSKVHGSWGSLVKPTLGRDARLYLDFSWRPMQ